MKKSEKAIAREFLFMQSSARQHHWGGAWYTPNEEGLGGTPLDLTLVNIGHIIKAFKSKHQVQKLNLVTLTDGDSHGVDFATSQPRGNQPALQLDGKIYKVDGGMRSYEKTEGYNKIIAQHYGVNMIGFYLPESRYAAKNQIEKARKSIHGKKPTGYLHYSEINTQSKKDMKSWKDEKHFVVQETMGYTSYYVLDTDLNIEDGADFESNIQDKSGKSMAESRGSQNRLAKEFAKHHSSSKNVRILMRKFADTIG
jgi:hypothetical protein